MRGVLLLLLAPLLAACAPKLVIVQGDKQVAAPNSKVRLDPRVRLTTTNGQPVPGVQVSFVPQGTGGTTSPPMVSTDANGEAWTSWTLGPAAGTQQMVASTSGVSVTFEATAASLPDLVASGGVAWPAVTECQDVAATSTITNAGPALAPIARLQSQLHAGRPPIIVEYPGILPGGSYTLPQQPLRLPPGSYTLTTTADPLNAVQEVDETNNVHTVPYTVTVSSGYGQAADPTGDAIVTSSGLTDIGAIEGHLIGCTLNLRVHFAAGWPQASTTASFHLDTDQNPSTGFPGLTNGGADAGLIGVEYVVTASSPPGTSGQAGVRRFVNGSFQPVSTVPITVLPHGYEIAVPLADLGDDDGRVDFKVTVAHAQGSGFTIYLDFAPDEGLAPVTVK